MAKNNSKHLKKQKKNNNKNYNKGYYIIAFVVVLFILYVLIKNFITYVSIKTTPKDIYFENIQIILNNENITSNLKNDVIVEQEKVYMSIEDIQNNIDETIYEEEPTGTVITTSCKKIATIKQGEDNIIINGSMKKIKDILIEKNEKKYIAISELENVYDYELKYLSNSNVLTIDNLNKECIKAYTKKDLRVKSEDKKSAVQVKKGEWVICIQEIEENVKIRTQSGIIGYVPKKALNNFIIERENLTEETGTFIEEKSLEYDITKKDISTYEKRLNIINLILQEAIKNDKMYVKIIYNGTENFEFERFKIEVIPSLQECGIKIYI